MVKEPIIIGNIQLNNRIVMPPVATYQSTEDGRVTEAMLDYYGKRATVGNIGMIVTEHSYINIQGKAKANQLSISSDDDIEGLSKLVSKVHQNGTKAMAQLNHAGSSTFESLIGMKKVSASTLSTPLSSGKDDGNPPEEITGEGIKAIVRDFAAAAGRAKEAGYDGVEIHSAHSYLLNQFYSPLTNKRNDQYGGSVENRVRFHKEVIQAVREKVGQDYTISVRLGGCDYMEGGSTIEDAVKASVLLESYGVDMISLSGGMCGYIYKGHNEPGYFKDMSIPVKGAVSIPVLLTGGVKTLADAESLLKEGAADLIGVGRALFNNPNWPN